jgi:hypothetical protein
MSMPCGSSLKLLKKLSRRDKKLNDDISKAFNKNAMVGNDFTELDEDKKEAAILMRAIYYPRTADKHGKPPYYLSNDEVSFVSKRCLVKYGLDAIRKFYEQVKKDDLLGKRMDFDLDSMGDDLDLFLGFAHKEKVKPKDDKPQISDEQQSNRYMHLIYAPNQTNVDVLKGKPIEKITHLSKTMAAKYGHKAIEILMDFLIWHRKIPRKGQWTHLTVEADILAAIKWSVEKPDEYLKKQESN